MKTGDVHKIILPLVLIPFVAIFMGLLFRRLDWLVVL